MDLKNDNSSSMKTKTSRTQGSRYYPKRYDAAPDSRDAILDEGLVCHVAFTLDNQPFIIPAGYCRVKNTLYLHGSVGSHFFMQMARGIPVCVSVTHVDGLVLARSVFHHSMNYRSVVAFGKTRLVEDEAERLLAAESFTEHILPGRWADARQPNKSEMKKTMFIAVEIEEASVKFRAHGVVDDEEDMNLHVWAGVLPLKLTPQAPQPDETGKTGINLPDYIRDYHRPHKQNDSLTLRPMRVEDNPQVATVIRTVMTEYGAVGTGYSIEDPEVDAMYQAYDNERSLFLVLQTPDGRVVGCGGIAPLRGGDPDTCELKKMYFLPEARGKGQGLKIVALLEEEARRRGFRFMYLETIAAMREANGLYKRLDFQPLAGPMGNTGHTACGLFYGKNLSSGEAFSSAR